MYCLARLDDYGALSEFLESVNPRDSTVIPNRGGIKEVGEKCFAEEHYKAAKYFFEFVGDWSRLSLTLVKLRCLKEAVEAATRAADPECWKAVAAECLEIRDFELAKSVFLNLVLVESELPSIVQYYEEYGFIEELLEVLEAGAEQPQAATYTSMETNIFTILAILYCKYMWIVRKTDPSVYKRISRRTETKSISRLFCTGPVRQGSGESTRICWQRPVTSTRLSLR